MEEAVELSNQVVCYTNETKDFIKTMVKYGGLNQTIYLQGASGIGKSEIVKQLATELDLELYDIRLGLYDTMDLNGIGIPDIEKQLAIFTRPIIYPPENEKNKKYLVFLDEMNQGDDKVLGSTYQMALERRVGTHKFPDNVLIIGAGNRICDNGIAFELPSPLVNRFTTINVETNIEDWLDHAKENNIDWRILGFLKTHSEYLHKFIPNSKEDNFPTPRQWFEVNKFIPAFENKRFLEILTNGKLGLSCSIAFRNYLELASKIPFIKDILIGNEVEDLGNELSSSYAFSMLASSYTKNHIEEMKIEEFFNLFDYIEKQESNVEAMYMLGIELSIILNLELDKEDISTEVKNKIEKIHYLICEKNYFSENKEFIETIQSFSNSIK